MSAPNSKSIFTLSICLKTRWQIAVLFGAAQRFHDPPVPHSVTNLPWKRRCFEVLLLGQGIRWFSRRFQRQGGQTAVQPQISVKEIQLWRLLLVESMEEDEWKLHETRGKKTLNLYGNTMENLWKYYEHIHLIIISYRILSIFYILFFHLMPSSPEMLQIADGKWGPGP